MNQPNRQPASEMETVKTNEFQEKLRSLNFVNPSNAPKVTTDVHDDGVVQVIEHHSGERQDIKVMPNPIIRKLTAQ